MLSLDENYFPTRYHRVLGDVRRRKCHTISIPGKNYRDDYRDDSRVLHRRKCTRQQHLDMAGVDIPKVLSTARRSLAAKRVLNSTCASHD